MATREQLIQLLATNSDLVHIYNEGKPVVVGFFRSMSVESTFQTIYRSADPIQEKQLRESAGMEIPSWLDTLVAKWNALEE